jgi:neutral ceramidase
MKYIIYFLLSIIALVVIIFKPLSIDDFKKQDYYTNTSERIDALQYKKNKVKDIKIGWSRINFTPPTPSNFAGYSGRGKYTSVKDSVFANCFFIESNKGNYLILNFDLILIHQTFSSALEKILLSDKSLNIKGIYYTCSHSHSSYGGWAKGLLAKFVLGGYQQEIIDFMVKQTKKMVQDAQENCMTAEVAFTKIKLKNYVLNRVARGSYVDDELRLMVFKNKENKKAALISFSGHPTMIPMKERFLSGDFPTMCSNNLIDSLNLESILFVSGAIGSTSPTPQQGYQTAQKFAKRISDTIIPFYNKLKYKPISNFNYNEVAIDLPSPQFKLNNDIVLRSFWFRLVFGNPQAKLSSLEINNYIFLGISGEISGETFKQVLKKSIKNDKQYIPTSFNGDYIGYLTKSQHYYSRESSETRDMNLYGPTNSDFFIEAISQFINNMNK